MVGATERDAVVGNELREVLHQHADRLRAAGVPSPEVDAWLLAVHVLGDERVRRGSSSLESSERSRLADLVARRAERVPLQHLVGMVWFRHVQLRCRPGVFIPRPETEVVAGLAVEAARALAHPVIVEPCTGSGAIAVSLAAEVAGARIIATDRSDEAVRLARHNLERLERGEAGVAGPASGASWDVRDGDLLAPADPELRGMVDVLVSNPPYMPAADRARWEPEVADHDPVAATIGGDDGHEVVWRLLDVAVEWLAPGGTLIVEIDERRGEETALRARRLGYEEVVIRRDLTGADRALVARRLHAAERSDRDGRPDTGEPV